MLKEEFEKLTGKEVTWETYQKWNDLYMDCDQSKQDFCKRVKPLVQERKPNPKPRYMIGSEYIYGERYYKYWVYEMVDSDIKTGITTLKEIGYAFGTCDLKDIFKIDYYKLPDWLTPPNDWIKTNKQLKIIT